MSAYVERVIGESQFQMMKAEFEWKVLPEMHPESVGVSNILNHVIQVTTVINNALKRRERKGLKLAISYMETMKWEVLVVEDDAAAFACCLPGGKIVVFTGLLKHLTTDDEIATIICHEVGHVMRHARKRLVKNLYRAFRRQIYYMVVRPKLDPKEVFFMLDLPFSPRIQSASRTKVLTQD
ncbi:hypothetical protein M8C21_024244 [Ambrosia artemisiifolia]|uniref:Peptidase M48 domain-containing protein n=1 Tax=Ambrosia artemisiifolia TaxID=4212 RepID=A0AAD5D0X6_AMBAR|nr:hypothetical protein M8C21_024244 [Ambrosia artemisiifolia]